MVDYIIFGFGLVVTVIVGFGLTTMVIINNRMIEKDAEDAATTPELAPVKSNSPAGKSG
tara:strand:+ start:56305 stop:56481 length:177 start_codon:yes stop_codon:yes gene_type:complete